MKFNLKKLTSLIDEHRKTTTIGIFVLIVSAGILVFLAPALFDYYYEEPLDEEDNDIDSVLWRFGKGMPGTGATMQPEKVSFISGGEEYIVVGTDGGIATLTLDGIISMSYMTFGDVISFELIEDISGDGQKDIVLIVYDRDHANVIAIASSNGEEIWKYDPRVKGYDSETFATREFITYTWDLVVIDDIDDDGTDDVVISSWNRIIALEGDEGDEIWINNDACTNDIWNIEVLDDKIIAGSEAGELVAVDMEDGKLEWVSEIEPTTTILLRSMAVVVEREIASSINDIIIDGDNIIVSADNGYIYLVSGDDGDELDDYEVHEIDEYEDYVGDTSDALTSPYSCERRIFQRAGLKLFEIKDINNDGSNEYMAISFHLEYSEEDFHDIEDLEFEGFIFKCDDDEIDDTLGGDFSYDETLYTASYPEFIRVDSEVRCYFFRNNFEGTTGGESNYQGIYYNDYVTDSLNPTRSTRVVKTGDEWEDEANDDDTRGKYLLNVGDVNEDGSDDLFAISDDGKYLLIDTKNSQTIWSRSKAAGGSELIPIEDIDNDGVRDFLFKKYSDFEPTWREYSGEDIDVPSWNYYGTEEGDPAEDQIIISEFLTISARTGRVIWEFSVPDPAYYEGLREVINIGDVDGDNIDDYAGWIIPSDYPPEVLNHIRDISGGTSVSTTTYGPERNNYVEEAINRALLVGYTRFLAINGSNGLIFWNTPLIDFPYKYYRDYEYGGNYNDPTNPQVNAGEIYHRTYDRIPLNWTNYASDSDRDHILWTNPWDSSTLMHATNLGRESGTTSDSLFDLWGDNGKNHTITSYNSSALALIGNPQTSSSEETKEQDNYNWVVDSESSSGSQKISLEMSFNQSLEIQSDSDYLMIDYAGNLTTKVAQIELFIYNFSDDNWIKISPKSINSTSFTTMQKTFEDIQDIVKAADNNRVKIKIEATDSNSFSLSIDELVVNYIYELGNYTLKAEQAGSTWVTSINLTIPLQFGTDYHELAQIDRISAFKMQTKALIDLTGPEEWRSFNFIYEILNSTSGQWSPFYINASSRYLNKDHPMNAWYGGYKNSSTGGFRHNATSFELSDVLRYDMMYIIRRGTYNPSGLWGIDDGIDFDGENRTIMWPFIDANNNVKIRINITNTNKPFNLTIDSFGLGVFYWGVFGNDWDSSYVYNLETDEWDENLDNILNLKILDFKAINGTGNDSFDVVVVAGFETSGSWSSRLILFNVKNQTINAQWDRNSRDIVPYNIVSITYLNNTQNGWLLSGTFNDPSTLFSHKYIQNANWDNTITNYDNYTDPTITYKATSIDITNQWSQFYEVPGTVEYRWGKLGIILGQYGDYNDYHEKIKIINPDTLATICIINPTNLDYLGRSQYWTTRRNDFSMEGAGYKIRFSYADFTGDGYFEHVALAEGGRVIKIFSGTTVDPGDAFVSIDLEELIEEGEVSDKYNEWSEEVDTSFNLPFASCGDINDDHREDGIVGMQMAKQEWDERLYSKGAAVLCLDITSSSGTDLELIEFENSGDDNDDDDERGFDKDAWQLETYDYEYEWSDDRYEYVDFMENIGDFNDDGEDDIICGHRTYTRAEGAYITGYITDLLDVYNQELLYRFNLESVEAIYPVGDITGDGNNEFILASGESFFCINSEFEVEFKNIDDDDEMSSSRFTIEWETEGDYDYFELVINDNSYCITEYTECKVSLGQGEKKVQIFMYDKSGVVIAVDEVNITVPADYSMWVLTVIIAGISAALVVTYRRMKNKNKGIVLIDKDKKMEELKI